MLANKVSLFNLANTASKSLSFLIMSLYAYESWLMSTQNSLTVNLKSLPAFSEVAEFWENQISSSNGKTSFYYFTNHIEPKQVWLLQFAKSRRMFLQGCFMSVTGESRIMSSIISYNLAYKQYSSENIEKIKCLGSNMTILQSSKLTNSKFSNAAGSIHQELTLYNIIFSFLFFSTAICKWYRCE